MTIADHRRSEVALSGLGLQVVAGNLAPCGRIALRAWAMIPSSVRERLMFSGLPTDIALQKGLQFCLAGPQQLRVRFVGAPLADISFDASSSHKYFLLGMGYERELQGLLRSLVTSDDVVYDVGAHFGWWTLWFSRMCGRVVAFEPSPTSFAVLRSNVESNSCSNVALLNAAASDRNGEFAFVEGGTSSHVTTDVSQPHVTVRAMRIDDFQDACYPTLIKIDVEGFAAGVLAGMSAVLRAASPCIVCEIHNTAEDTAVGEILGNLGYRISRLESGKKFPWHILAKRS